jgi:hypothetical protein
MKNVMVVNLNKKSKINKEYLLTNIKAQIENCLEVDWKPEDICIVSNFDFEYKGVKAMKASLNKHCLTGSKMFGLQWLMEQDVSDVYWAHDLDCWQQVPFECPDFKDVGIAEYSTPRYNGGSVFWRNTAKDIVATVVDAIVKEKSEKEEPILNRILKSDKYKKRVVVLNSTYNLGCSGFVKRYTRAIKPIHVSHFHPTNRIAWETHALDRNSLGCKSISDRLEKLIRTFYPHVANEVVTKVKSKS